jgi:hypothetical protein
MLLVAALRRLERLVEHTSASSTSASTLLAIAGTRGGTLADDSQKAGLQSREEWFPLTRT